MVNKPKNIGTAAETAVVNYAKSLGYEGAQRIALSGSRDRGDVQLNGKVMLEVKAGAQVSGRTGDPKDCLLNEWMEQTLTEWVNGGWQFAALIVKRRGRARVGSWWVYLHHAHLDYLCQLPGHPRPYEGRGPLLRMVADDFFDLLANHPTLSE